MKIVIASHNKGKIKEFKEMLEPLGYFVQGVEALGLDVSKVVEDGDSFEENAIIKAKYVYDQLKIPVLSDDSGLVLNAFPDLLGIYSARYLEGESYQVKNQSLIELYENIDDRSAYFVSALVYYDGEEEVFVGTVKGKIAKEIKGTEGFGYDPIFIPENSNQSFSEMGAFEKSKISHRSIALDQFVAYLKEKEV